MDLFDWFFSLLVMFCILAPAVATMRVSGECSQIETENQWTTLEL